MYEAGCTLRGAIDRELIYWLYMLIVLICFGTLLLPGGLWAWVSNSLNEKLEVVLEGTYGNMEMQKERLKQIRGLTGFGYLKIILELLSIVAIFLMIRFSLYALNDHPRFSPDRFLCWTHSGEKEET